MTSLDRPLGDDESASLGDVVAVAPEHEQDGELAVDLREAALHRALAHLPEREQQLIRLRFGLPAELPAELTALIKAADRGAAYFEATRLAGFSASEARRFFGAPPKLSAAGEREYLVPWPAELAERRYLDRFAKLARG